MDDSDVYRRVIAELVRSLGHEVVGEAADSVAYTISAGERVLYGQRVLGSCASSTSPPAGVGAGTSSSAA